MAPTAGQLDELHDAVERAAARADACAAVQSVYDDLAGEVAKRRPLCVISGRCCRFEEYGHRLYVTTLELAAFSHGFAGSPKPPALVEAIGAWNGAGCPFQVGKLCGAHSARPFGCRIYFCDPSSTEWQQEAYEVFHARLKRLHEQLGVPYFYVEWRAALTALGYDG